MRSKRLLLPTACLFILVLAASIAAGCGKKEVTNNRPEITSVVPGSGAPGTQVKIIGERFGGTQGNGIVHIGMGIADVVAWSDTLVTVKVPKLPSATQGVTVLTDNGASNEMDFTVTGGSARQPDSKESGIEHVNAVQAMINFEQKKGADTTGMTFSVVQISDKDPDWKIDKAVKPGGQAIFFLLHREKGDWVVKDDGAALTDKELQADGAPGDLYGTPHPESQAQALWDYLKKQGENPAGATVSITRMSRIDPYWELGVANKPGAQPATVVFHQENGNWVVKGMGTGWTPDGLAKLGVPNDLVRTPTEAKAIIDFINSGQAEPGVEPTGWSLSVIKVSKIDSDWEVVKGVQPESGTMYFVLHWENGNWVVKDDGGTLQPSAVPGEPADIP